MSWNGLSCTLCGKSHLIFPDSKNSQKGFQFKDYVCYKCYDLYIMRENHSFTINPLFSMKIAILQRRIGLKNS